MAIDFIGVALRELTKEALAFNPVQSLKGTQQVANMSKVNTPSIAQLAKPKGYSTPMSATTKSGVQAPQAPFFKSQ